jgi:hypothetical protein
MAITEDQLNTAITSGKATMVDNPDSSTEPPKTPDAPAQEPTSVDQYVPLLAGLQSVQFTRTTPPTVAPQSFADQFQFVYDGVSAWFYFWANNQWNSIVIPPNKYGDGSDGDATISTTVTLTRDKFYNSLTIATGGILKPAGFRVYSKKPILVQSGGTLTVAGGDGGAGGAGGTISGAPGNGAGGTAGTAGTGISSGTIRQPGDGPAGTVGMTGNSNGDPNLKNGSNGVSEPHCVLPNNAGNGANSGTGAIFTSTGYSDNHSTGGTGGTATQLTKLSALDIALSLMVSGNPLGCNPTPGSGAGGGGGLPSVSSSASGGGGGGGGAGAPGGIAWLFAPAIIVSSGATITGIGGNGGHGGDGGSASNSGQQNVAGGGGGGGAAGNGGVILLITPSYSNAGTVTVAPGTGGIGGAAGSSSGSPVLAAAGATAANGTAGQIVQIVP